MRGKRRLAYSIGKHKEGIYVQLSHTGSGPHIETLERAMRLSEDVIRYLTVKQDGPLPTPKSSSKDEDEKSKTDEKEDIKTTEDKTESSGKEDEQKNSKD